MKMSKKLAKKIVESEAKFYTFKNWSSNKEWTTIMGEFERNLQAAARRVLAQKKAKK